MNKFMQTDHSVVQSRSKDKNNTGEEPSLDWLQGKAAGFKSHL